MLTNQRFDLLLKSFLRTSSVEAARAAKIMKVTPQRFKKLISYPLHLPELSEVEKIINNLKIPPDLVWQAYMNSVVKMFYVEGEVLLINYADYEQMIKNNKRHRKSGNIPHEEVFYFIDKDKKLSLNGGDLKFYYEHFKELKPGKDFLKKLSKKLYLPEKDLKLVIQGKIPSVKLLTDLVFCEPNSRHSMVLKYYLHLVIKKYKLPYKIEIYEAKTYSLLLDQIYS